MGKSRNIIEVNRWVVFQPLGHVAVVARTTTPSASAVAVLVVPTGRFWTIKKLQKQSMTCVYRTIYIYICTCIWLVVIIKN